MIEEADTGVVEVQVFGTFEDLDQDLLLRRQDDLAIAGVAPMVADLHPIAERHVGDAFDDQQAALRRTRPTVLDIAHDAASWVGAYSLRSLARDS